MLSEYDKEPLLFLRSSRFYLFFSLLFIFLALSLIYLEPNEDLLLWFGIWGLAKTQGLEVSWCHPRTLQNCFGRVAYIQTSLIIIGHCYTWRTFL